MHWFLTHWPGFTLATVVLLAVSMWGGGTLTQALLNRAQGAAELPFYGFRGGVWIGYLERIAITATIALGFPEGVAGVIAIKALARYPELKGDAAVNEEHPGNQSMLAERFIIGSMTSMLFAALCGVLIHGYRVVL